MTGPMHRHGWVHMHAYHLAELMGLLSALAFRDLELMHQGSVSLLLPAGCCDHSASVCD